MGVGDVIERHGAVLPALTDEHLTRLLAGPPGAAARAAALLQAPPEYRQAVEATVSEATSTTRTVTDGRNFWGYFELTGVQPEDAYRAALSRLARQGVRLRTHHTPH